LRAEKAGKGPGLAREGGGNRWTPIDGLPLGIFVCLATLIHGCDTISPSMKGAYGDYDMKFEGAPEQDSNAGFLAFRLEGIPKGKYEKERTAVGPGIETEFLLNGKDREEGSGEFEPFGFELTPYLGIYPYYWRFFRMPIRFGFLTHYRDFDSEPIDFTWLSFGTKASLEPELILIRSTEHEESLSIFGEGSGLAALSKADSSEDQAKRYKRLNSNLLGLGGEGGLKYRYLFFEVRGSFFFRWQTLHKAEQEYDSEDWWATAPPRIPGVDTTFMGVAVTIGFHF
jgi:hypothetical protein